MKPFVKVMRIGGVMPVATNLSVIEDFNNKEQLVIENTFEKKILGLENIYDVEPLKESKGQFKIKYYYKGKVNEDTFLTADIYLVLRTFRYYFPI
jgi:hypothetical protein